MNFGYKKLYINGSLQDSKEGSKQDVICPATGEKIAQIAEAGKSDAIKALNSARDGYKLWSKLTLNDRTNWMEKLRAAIIENERKLKIGYYLRNGENL